MKSRRTAETLWPKSECEEDESEWWIKISGNPVLGLGFNLIALRLPLS